MSALRLLAVLAHPDDETLGFGGTLARYAAEGIATHVVTATHGQSGRYHDLRPGDPGHPGAAGLAAIRERGYFTWGADEEGGGPYVFPDPADPTRRTGFEVDLAGFEAEMGEQRRRAKESRKGTGTEHLARAADFQSVLDEHGPTDFVGRDEFEVKAKVLAVVGDSVVLDRSPFYAESGGQVGDTGTIRTETGEARVIDTVYALPGLHRHVVEVVVEGAPQLHGLDDRQGVVAALGGARRVDDDGHVLAGGERPVDHRRVLERLLGGARELLADARALPRDAVVAPRPCGVRRPGGDHRGGRGRSRRRGAPGGRRAVTAPVRIASGQGFWGDWLEAPYRQVTGGPVDYLMMDYLAEVTMSIMQKQRARDPAAGYAKDFIPLMERILPVVQGARRLVLLLDYDGTLVPTALSPSSLCPTTSCWSCCGAWAPAAGPRCTWSADGPPGSSTGGSGTFRFTCTPSTAAFLARWGVLTGSGGTIPRRDGRKRFVPSCPTSRGALLVVRELRRGLAIARHSGRLLVRAIVPLSAIGNRRREVFRIVDCDLVVELLAVRGDRKPLPQVFRGARREVVREAFGLGREPDRIDDECGAFPPPDRMTEQ